MRLWAEEFLAAEGNAGDQRGRLKRRRGQGDAAQERAESGERGTPENTDELRDPGKTRDGPCGNRARSQSLHASEETSRVRKGRLLDDLVKAMAKDWKKLPIVLDIFREGAFFCGSPFLPPDTNDSITAFSSSSTSSSDRCGLRASALASTVFVSSSISSHLLLYLRVLSSFLLQLDHVYRDLGDFLPRLVRSSSASAASATCSPPLITELATLLHVILSSVPSFALPTAYDVSPSAGLTSSLSSSSSRSSTGPSYLSMLPVCCVSPPCSCSTSSAPWMAYPRFSRRLPAFFSRCSRNEKTGESPNISCRTKVQSAKAEASRASLGDLVAQLLAFLGKKNPRLFLREVLPSALNADEEAFALVALRLVPLWGEGLRSLLQGPAKTKRKEAERRRTGGGADKRGPLENVLQQREERGELERDDSEEREGRKEENERTSRDDQVRNGEAQKTFLEEAMRHTHTGHETTNLDEACIETWAAATEYLLQFCCNEISVLSLAPAPAREDPMDTGKREEEIHPGSAAFFLSKDPLLLHLALLVSTLRHLGPFLVSAQTAADNASAAEMRDIEPHTQSAFSGKRRRKEKNALVQALNHLSTLLRHPRASVRQAASWHTATLLFSCWSIPSSCCGLARLVTPPTAVGSSPLHSLLHADTRDEEATAGEETTEGTRVNEVGGNARGSLALRGEVQNAQCEERGAANSGKEEGEIEKSCTCREGVETTFSPLALLPLLWETKVVCWEVRAEQSEEGRHGVKERESEDENATGRGDRAGSGTLRSRLHLQTLKQDARQPELAHIFLHLLEEDRRLTRIDTPAILAHALPALDALRASSLRPLHLSLLATFLLHPRTDRGAAQQILDVLAEVYIRNIRCSLASRFAAAPRASDQFCHSPSSAPSNLDSCPRPLGSEAGGQQESKKNDLGDINGPLFPSTQHGILSVLFLAFCFSPSLRESCWLSTWLPSFLDQEENTLQAEMQRHRNRSQLSSAKQLERTQTPHQTYPSMEAREASCAPKFLLGRVEEEERRDEEEERRSRERRILARSHGDGEEVGQQPACDREGDRAAQLRKKEVLQKLRTICETHLATLQQGREERGLQKLEVNDGEAEERQKESPSAKRAAVQQPDRDLRESVAFDEDHLGGEGSRHSTEKDPKTMTEVTVRRENTCQPAVRSTLPRPSSSSSSSSSCSPLVSPQSPTPPSCVAANPHESAFDVEAAGGRTSPVCLVPGGERSKTQQKDVISTSTLPRLLPLFQLSADSTNREVLFASSRLLKQRQKRQMDDPRRGDAKGSGTCGRGAGGQDALPSPTGPTEISQDELGLLISQLALLTGQQAWPQASSWGVRDSLLGDMKLLEKGLLQRRLSSLNAELQNAMASARPPGWSRLDSTPSSHRKAM
ncbi:UNVERIFIED_CONTAM: hypothetical protein HHA_254160 [Hammondia hammondi]|eukprot:XP_008885034.1 hypothetical protein HHA_254160 [Hammondia hammondi]